MKKPIYQIISPQQSQVEEKKDEENDLSSKLLSLFDALDRNNSLIMDISKVKHL